MTSQLRRLFEAAQDDEELRVLNDIAQRAGLVPDYGDEEMEIPEPLTTYNVKLSAVADYERTAVVQARNAREAAEKALAIPPGDFVWSYAGLRDDTVEVTSVTGA